MEETKNPHIDELTYNYFKVGSTVVIAHYMIGTDIICYDLKGNSKICKLSDLECIPITKEWLDKNFERVEEFNKIRYWRDKSGQINIQYNALINRNDAVNVHVDNRDFDSIGSADIVYVHEYQNFLRAIGERNLLEEFKF